MAVGYGLLILIFIGWLNYIHKCLQVSYVPSMSIRLCISGHNVETTTVAIHGSICILYKCGPCISTSMALCASVTELLSVSALVQKFCMYFIS